ncbi:carboxylesterase [Staphylococcus warneri]
MMNIKSPSPLYLKGTSQQAILLLHSFTGAVKDVKHLATTLNEQGFTCYVPNYPGHGLPVTQFIKYDVNDWWACVQEAYQFLKEEGYEVINAAGVSLGGLFTLRLAENVELNRIVVMSAPSEKTEAGIAWRLEKYGKRMNQIMRLSEDESVESLAQIDQYQDEIKVFQGVINDIMSNLHDIKSTARILYGGQDEAAYEESAHYIFNQISSDNKSIQDFPLNQHLMTHGEGRDELEQDIVEFFTQK